MIRAYAAISDGGCRPDKRHWLLNQTSCIEVGRWDILLLTLDYSRMRSLIFFFLLFALSCGPSISVYHDYDSEKNISHYETYNWKVYSEIESNRNPIYYNELNDKRIKTAVNRAMQKKGYRQVDFGPDIAIHYHIVVEDKTVFMMDPGGHQYGLYWMKDEMNQYQYQQGTLIIDLMDSRTNDLVWRGWAVAVLEDLRPEKVEEMLNKTIDRIFEPLPLSDRNSSASN